MAFGGSGSKIDAGVTDAIVQDGTLSNQMIMDGSIAGLIDYMKNHPDEFKGDTGAQGPADAKAVRLA